MKHFLLFFFCLLTYASFAQTADTSDQPLIIPLPADTISGIIIQRQAVARSIEINAYEKEVILNVMVEYKGQDGKVINEPSIGIQPFIRRLVADNNTLADATTGMPLCDVAEEYIDNPNAGQAGQPQKILNPVLVGKTYNKQYTLFHAMMKVPVVIDQMITAHILNAYAMGKLN